MSSDSQPSVQISVSISPDNPAPGMVDEEAPTREQPAVKAKASVKEHRSDLAVTEAYNPSVASMLQPQKAPSGQETAVRSLLLPGDRDCAGGDRAAAWLVPMSFLAGP